MKSSSNTALPEAPMGEFRVSNAHGIAHRDGSCVRLSSQGRGWTSMYAWVQRESPCEARFEACPHHLIILRLGRGGLFILPSGMSGSVRVDHPIESIHFYLHERILREVAGTFGVPPADPIRVVARFSVRDAFLEHLALAVLELLESADCHSAVHADFLARTVAAHLLLRYWSRTAQSPARGGRTTGSLAPVLSYMQVNFSKRLSIAELARIARLSEQQFSRKFKQLMGITAHHHLLALRVERAKRMLQQDASIAEVALACGFAHQEHLTNVFRRFTHLTPASYRREVRLRAPEHADSHRIIHPPTQTQREMQ